MKVMTGFSLFLPGWRECVGVKSQLRNHEGLVRKLLEDAREPTYRGFCIGDTGLGVGGAASL